MARQNSRTSADTKSGSRVAVIGAGITGLAAALRIHETAPELELSVLDSAARTGGVLQTVRQDAFLIERSADAFITNVPWATDLCDRVGLAEELQSTNEVCRRAFVVNRGRLASIPEGFMIMAPGRIWPLITTRILSLRGKLRLAAECLVRRRRDSDRDSDDESLESFARRRFGAETFQRLIQPLVGGIYTADPSQLSLRSTLPQFLDMERDHGSLIKAALRKARAQGRDTGGSAARYGLFTAPRGGMSSLVDAVTSRLPPACLRLTSAVSSLVRTADGRWSIDVPGEQPLCVDAVLLAAPADSAAEIMRATDPELARQLGQIPHAGTAVVSLGFRREQIQHPLDGFGFVVPMIENRRILSGSFSSVKFAGRAPEHCVLIRVFIGGACQPELVQLPDQDLVQLAIRELGELLGVRQDPLTVHVTRWPAAMPQYHVGHRQRIERIRRLVAEHPGIELAGKSYDGIGIPSCIRSGEQAADRLLTAGRFMC